MVTSTIVGILPGGGECGHQNNCRDTTRCNTLVFHIVICCIIYAHRSVYILFIRIAACVSYSHTLLSVSYLYILLLMYLIHTHFCVCTLFIHIAECVSYLYTLL